MDFKFHFQKAWNLMLEHIVSLILLTLAMFGISMISLGILGPVTMAGYTQAILQMTRDGREPRIQDLFSHISLFFPLLGFSILVCIAAFIGFALLFLPGLLVVFGVTFLCTYLLPVMTDQQRPLFEALQTSYTMAVKQNAAEHLIVVILYVCVLAVGGSFFIGSLLTVPFATIFLMSVFDEKMRNNPPVNL